MDNLQLTALDVIYRALRKSQDLRINDVTMDNDNHDGEVILTLDDGKEKHVMVIKSTDIIETDNPEDA